MQVLYLKFCILIANVAVEGTVSQTFHIGLGSILIKYRKNIQIKKQKVTLFLP